MMQGQADILSDPRSDEISYWTLISISQSRKAPFFSPTTLFGLPLQGWGDFALFTQARCEGHSH